MNGADDKDILHQISKRLYAGDSMQVVAERLNVNPAHVWRAKKHKHVTPTLLRAARRAGWVDYEPRRRFAADVDEATQQRIARLRDATGLDNGGLLLAALDMLEGELMRGVYPATAPAVTHAASQSPESAAPHPRRQSASLPLL